MPNPTSPESLAAGGRTLWVSISAGHDDLDPMQLVQLEEACRAKDRLDKLDMLLRGDVDVWATLVESFDGTTSDLRINAALTQANATANAMKQLLAAMRLADDTGKRPQFRGPRGAQAPSVPGGAPAKVSSLDRARAARGA